MRQLLTGALIIGAPVTFPYIRGSATNNAAALTALGEKPWAALEFLAQPNGWRSAAQLVRIHHRLLFSISAVARSPH